MPRGKTAEQLAAYRAKRWANTPVEERKAIMRSVGAVKWARLRNTSLERCISIQDMLARTMYVAFQQEDWDRVIMASGALAAWERIRLVREKMEPQLVQYQPTPEEPSEAVLSGVDQEELERLATSVPAYRGAGSDTGKNPITRRPFRQRTPGLVTGIAEQDQKAAARRKEEAQIATNARPLHEEEE